MEDVQDKVTRQQRLETLRIVVPNYNEDSPDIVNNAEDSILEYIANLVENAYIAGANGVNISVGYKGTFDMKDTGPYRVAARNYVKDKGLRL